MCIKKEPAMPSLEFPTEMINPLESIALNINAFIIFLWIVVGERFYADCENCGCNFKYNFH